MRQNANVPIDNSNYFIINTFHVPKNKFFVTIVFIVCILKLNCVCAQPFQNSFSNTIDEAKNIKSIDKNAQTNMMSNSQASVVNRNLTLNNKTKIDTKNIDPIWYLNKFGYLEDKKSILSSSKTSGRLIMLPSFSANNNLINNKSIEIAIKKFQKYAGLNITGQLDSETLKMMKMPRCGHPDLINSKNKNPFRKKRYALQGSKWSKSKLRFRIAKYPKYSSMTRDSINQELKRAFDLWADAADVDFELVKEPIKNDFLNNLLLFDQNTKINVDKKADIDVRFETGFHGDSEPFDGSGLILGHAYFPEFGGSTHFDADEIWTSRSADGVNLFQVAVHEFGHALGLEHSENYDAIMAPFFRGYSEDFKLHNDDLTAIELLYGKSKRQVNKNGINKFNLYSNNLPSFYETKHDFNQPANKPEIKPIIPQQFPPSIPTIETKNKFANNQPDFFDQSLNSLCLDGKFDTISVLQDGFTYIFKDAYVFKMNSNFMMDVDYPKLISNVFKGWNGVTFMTLPSNLDSVLYIPDNKITYFFKNNLYWRSSKLYELDPGYPRIISENFRGLNKQNGFDGKLDASFVWSGNRRVYFVQDNRYWRYDFTIGGVEPGYPKRLSVWRGLPNKITSAFLWINGITYFFDKEKYYRFNDLSFKVEEASPPYPRYNAEYWFSCTNFNKLGKLVWNTSISYETPTTLGPLDQSEIESIDQNRLDLNYTIIQPTTSKIETETHIPSLIAILAEKLNKKEFLQNEQINNQTELDIGSKSEFIITNETNNRLEGLSKGYLNNGNNSNPKKNAFSFFYIFFIHFAIVLLRL